MIKEKHVLTNPYNHHALSRYIDVYEVTTDGCSSSPMSGYKGTEATLVDNPAWNEKFSSYSITGATLTGNNFVINNDVTAKANYETAKNLTLQTDGHGSIAANRTSGFIGDQVTLSNTANSGYTFTGYSITGAILTGNKFNFIGNDVIAKANFIDKYNPLGLPANTIRCKFVKGYTPTMGNSRTLVDSTNNIWDIYKASNDWSRLFGEDLLGSHYLLEVLGANTSNVTNMFSVFEYCSSLTSVALFDTSNVTNMIGMFYFCSSLTSIPLFYTSNVLTMALMCYACYGVQSGALALYQQASTQANIPSHSEAFYNCGINTTQGAAELAQIPSDWK